MVTGYASVNGLKMYYEIEGVGEPLVYIPPALGCAGIKSFPEFVEDFSLITVDLQGHGRTADIPDRPLSIEQHAKDVVGLLNHFEIAHADFFGESYGGAIATMIAVRHPQMVKRISTYGATFGPSQTAVDPKMLHFDKAPTPDSTAFQFQKEYYKLVAPYPNDWAQLWNKSIQMQWEGFSDDDLASIKAPLLIALGDHDFVRLEHALEVFRRIPIAELAVIPDAGHFALFSEQERVTLAVRHFLKKPDDRMPIATAQLGYQPDKTR
jgi:pimeloyl-ACP methyl ester carboxylesterase